MLIFFIFVILITGIILVLYHKKNKSKAVKYASTKNHQTYNAPSNHATLCIKELTDKVTILINDRNLFAAEATLYEALRQHENSTELYHLLFEIYLLRQDEFSINMLFNKLHNLGLDEISNQIKEKIKEKNIQSIESIDFVSPRMSSIEKESKQDHNHQTQYQNNENTIEFIEIKSPSTPSIQPDIITLNFQLAQKYIELGHYAEAKKIIQEQEKNYNQEQQNLANQLLKQIVT
jgi:hypothetical protein